MQQNFDLGIQSVQAGNMEEGARLLRIALNDPNLPGQMRAVAFTWLAETQPDPQFKIDCYQKALETDPGNQHVQQRLDYFLSIQPPAQSSPPPMQQPPAPQPTPPPQSSPPRQQTSTAPPPPPPQGVPEPVPPPSIPERPPSAPTPQPRSQQPSGSTIQGTRPLGIHGGSNGVGTGLFVHENGLIATTRYVVGGTSEVKVDVSDNQQINGNVVRSYPEYDVALIKTDARVSSLIPLLENVSIVPNMPLTAYVHSGQKLNATIQETKHQLPAQWIPTTFGRMLDAGGNPIFNEQGQMIGLLTKNASRSSGYVYGFHSGMLTRIVQHYLQEMQTGSNRTYCYRCGYASQAGQYRAYYCENCGGTLPYAENTDRVPQPNTFFLYEPGNIPPCRNCAATVGYHNNVCLRCGTQQ